VVFLRQKPLLATRSSFGHT